MVEVITEFGELSGICGHDGTNWQKLGLLFGYYDRWFEDLSGTAEGAYFSAESTPVEEGYVHILQAAYIANNSKAGSNLQILVKGTAAPTLILNDVLGIAAYLNLCWSGEVVLKYGDVAQMLGSGCDDDDSVVCGVWGYKMKIDP